MSIDRYLYLGTYLKVRSFKISTDEPVRGCPNCKKCSKDKFCNQSGSPIGEYNKPCSVKRIGELLSHHEEIDPDFDADVLFDTFMMTEENVIIPNKDTGFGSTMSVEYDSFEESFPVPSFTAAAEFFKPMTDIFDIYAIEHHFVTGAYYFCQ